MLFGWQKKCQKNMSGGWGGMREPFLGKISVGRGEGRGHAGYRPGPAYISVLFLYGLRELSVGWAHKKSMWLHVL